MIRFFRRPQPDPPPPSAPPRVPDGERVYAIGDVHGRLDLLTDLITRIEADNAARGPADTQLILLGDLIDRGPQSAELIEYLRSFHPGFARVRLLMGNHEAAMLDSLDDRTGDPHRTGWLEYGGLATLASYGVPYRVYGLPGPAMVAALRQYVPAAHLDFLRGFEDHVTVGDYLFVHAGIRPGVPLAAQNRRDLHWIRGEFLDDPRPHGFTVVHGHTISDAPEFRPNRIGIDTGAYRSGVLTALGLEGEAQWTLATEGEPAPPYQRMADILGATGTSLDR
jgi:serine/threonine protein phosphatase 1